MSALGLLLRPTVIEKMQCRFPRGHELAGARVPGPHQAKPLPQPGRAKPKGSWFSNARAWADHTYGGSYPGGWTTNVDYVQVKRGHRLGDHVEVRGKVTRFSKPAGHFTRRIFDDGTVEHSFFELDRSHQGSGFAKQFLHRSEDAYLDAGLKYIRLHANVGSGAYAWSRYGFTYASPREAMSQAKMVDRVRRDIARGAKDTADIPRYPGIDDDLRTVVAKGGRMTPQGVAEVGFRHATEDRHGYKTWAGKAILLHTSQDGWEGVKPVQERADRAY